MISAIVAVIVAVLGATWKLSSQIGALDATLKGMREDLQEALPMVHDHETRLTVVENKLNQ